jgi:hypothetical protein
MPLAQRNVLFGFRQMLKKLPSAIHAPLHRNAGGSAIGLSATDA